MYSIGSLFYAIYFFVSFPMFIRIDEDPGKKWSLGEVRFVANSTQSSLVKTWCFECKSCVSMALMQVCSVSS